MDIFRNGKDQLTSSKPCPIGLECLIGIATNQPSADGVWCINAEYCRSMALPWPLSYTFESEENFGVLEAKIPFLFPGDENDDGYIPEDKLASLPTSIASIYRLRREYRKAGWLDAELLPYFYDSEKLVLIVWDVLERHGFYPAVPLERSPCNYIHNRGDVLPALTDKRYSAGFSPHEKKFPVSSSLI